MRRNESPPPAFSERWYSPCSDDSPPRFMEHLNASPPYQHFPDNGSECAPIPRYESHGVPRHKRLSLKGRSRSPHAEYISSRPQAYKADHEEKQVLQTPALELSMRHGDAGDKIQERRICGVPLSWFLIVIAFILALAIGVGVGLGVGLWIIKPSKDPVVDTEYLIGGAINPTYFSRKGAFNGSGIAFASESFVKDLDHCSQGSAVVYFQHWTGQIRSMQLSCTTGQWGGGDSSTIVAEDAKNGTTLSAVAYSYGGVNSWHIFYIDQNNMLRQRSNSNQTNLWVNGTINDLNIAVLDADEVGMQACWYGNHYGDSDYTHSPDAPDGSNITAVNQYHDVGMHIWYAKDNTTFQQLGWRAGETSWEPQQTFENKNGHAGVACYSWGPGPTTYVMFVNLENTVEFYWKDTATNHTNNTNNTNNTTHPINVWTNSSIAINGVYPSSSLGFTNAFYVQRADLQIYGYNITWASENTFITDSFMVTGSPGLPGTHMTVSAIPSSSGGDDLLVYYQVNGSDITEYTRDFVAGDWTSIELPISNT